MTDCATRSRSVRLAGDPILASLTLPSLQTVHILEISGTALTSLDASASVTSDLTGVAGMYADPGLVLISDNTSLPSSAIQSFLHALEAKYPGAAFPDGVSAIGNGG